MKNKFIVLTFILILLFNIGFSQYHISGFVIDQQTGERLIGASIVESATTNGTSADNNGYFSLVTKGHSIQVSFIGYKTTTFQVNSDTLINILLEGGELLNEVTVRGEKFKHFNIASLSHKEMLSIPSIGGKPDVLKALQLLPGIQSQQEGSSLLNVRGGNPGENLYLIDNIPLIYVNHLGGFMSVFNPDMINNMEVYKGGFPSKYGGKLSSIVSITQREGDKSGLKASLGIGVTDISFSMEGPLLKKKASFIFTGRKTLTEPLFLLASELTDGDYYVIYGFHDLNGKFSWHPNEKNSVFLNFYQGDDYIKYWNRDKNSTHYQASEKFSLTNAWGNWMVAARWNCVITPRLFVDNTFSYTRYRLSNVSNYSTDTNDYENRYLSVVEDLSLRSDLQYKILRTWSMDFGAKTTLFTHIPNKVYQSTQQVLQNYEVINSYESTLFFNNNISLFYFIDINVGMRLINYRSGKFNDVSLEPRLLINTKISETQLLNFSYQKVNQYAHLLFTSGSFMNNEVWVPATENILPANSIQYSAGWKGEFFNDNYMAEANLYYKKLNKLSTYKEGYSNIMGDGDWRSKIETDGGGTAKGMEVLIRKEKGEWTGFMGYTYSKSTRRYKGINDGEEYLFDYDRPHSLSINLNRQLNEKWAFNLSWMYQTGLPYTPVVGRQLTPIIGSEVDYNEEFIYGVRNSLRMKDYHRMDVGLSYTAQTKEGRRAIWNFSVYNLYNRHNPASYYYGINKDGEMNSNNLVSYKPLNQYQTSFFPILPTVSYKVFFEADPASKAKHKLGIKQKIKNFFFYEH